MPALAFVDHQGRPLSNEAPTPQTTPVEVEPSLDQLAAMQAAEQSTTGKQTK